MDPEDQATIDQMMMDEAEDRWERIMAAVHVEDEEALWRMYYNDHEAWEEYYAPPVSVREQVQRRHGLGFSQPGED